MKRSVCVLAAFVFASLFVFAQAPVAKRVIVRPAHLLEVKTGQLLANQQIVVEGEKIVSVGAVGGDTTGTTVINVPGTLLPGLIDAHTHLTMNPQDTGMSGLAISGPRAALFGAKNARLTLEAGFTTVRNVGAWPGYPDVALRDAINAGDIPGPHMLVSGPGLGITGGHCDDNLLPFEFHQEADGVADGIGAVQQKVRQNIKYGADLIKVCATGGVMSKGDDPNASQYTLEEMRAIVADAHRLGRKVAAHAHGAEGVRWASEAGVDSVEHGHLMDDASIATLKKNGTYLVPTVYLLDWYGENMSKTGAPDYVQQKMQMVRAQGQANVKRAIDAGVKIALGTDAAVYPHGLNAGELVTYVKLGMTPIQAIRTATLNGADLLGWTDKVGTIEAGKFADLIAVDGDPTKEITTLQHVKFVMKSGMVYKNDFGK